MLRAALALWLLLVAGAAFGQTFTTRTIVEYKPAGSNVLRPNPTDFQRLMAGPANFSDHGNSAQFKDLIASKPYRIPDWTDPSKLSPSTANTTARVPWKNIGRAAAKSIPIIGTAVAVADMMNELECVLQPTNPICDLGQSKVPVQCLMVVVGGYGDAGCVTSPGQAPGQAVSFMTRIRPSREQWFGGFRCTWQITYSGGAVNGSSWTITETGVGSCDNSNYVGQLSVFVENRGATLQCPEGKRPLRYDGDRCTSGNPTAMSEEAFGDHFEKEAPPDKVRPFAQALDQAGVPIVTEIPTVVDVVPPTIPGDSVLTRGGDGSQTITERWTRLSPDPGNPTQIKIDPETRTRTYPPGVTPPAPFTDLPGGPGTTPTPPPPGVTETTSTGTSPTEVKTCGLPTTPPCKIDESGTPQAQPPDMAEITKGKDALTGKIAELGGLQAPSWSWGFQLPTACGPIPVGGFAEYGFTEVDICRFQPAFHDLMSMIWIGACLWGCISLINRALLGG